MIIDGFFLYCGGIRYGKAINFKCKECPLFSKEKVENSWWIPPIDKCIVPERLKR